jgi:hypothetical protein
MLRVYFVSGTTQVELKSGRVSARDFRLRRQGAVLAGAAGAAGEVGRCRLTLSDPR